MQTFVALCSVNYKKAEIEVTNGFQNINSNKFGNGMIKLPHKTL